MQFSPWKSALVDQDVDDDLSVEVDLEGNYKYLLVLIPTITSSTVTVHVSNASGGTFYPLYDFVRLNNADTIVDTPIITTAATTSHSIIFMIGGAQFIQIACGSSQAADVTFVVRGFN